jgi:hypothetical protein
MTGILAKLNFREFRTCELRRIPNSSSTSFVNIRQEEVGPEPLKSMDSGRRKVGELPKVVGRA